MLRRNIRFISLCCAIVLGVIGCPQAEQASSDVPRNTAQPAFIQPSPQPTTSLWRALSDDFHLPSARRQPDVRREIAWLARHPTYINKLANNARPYLYYVYHETKRRGLPAEVALLPMIESAYDPFAYSRAGAAGLWQIMPGTATGFGIKQNWWYDGRRDVVASTNAALNYLTYLHSFFNGKWMLAMAAYDSGEGRVQQSVNENRARHRRTDFWSLNLPRETQAYVPRLLALVEIIKHPHRYGVRLPALPDRPYFKKIKIGFQIDLAKAAKLAKIPLSKLYMLNPGYNRWATSPTGPYQLLLPINAVTRFETRLAKLPKHHRVSWQRHIVKHGDNLSLIAARYHSKVHLIKSVNKLKGNTIHAGRVLLIPASSKHAPRRHHGNKKRYAAIHAHHAGPTKYMHVVKAGDSFWKIEKLYKVKAQAIRFWNHLKYNDDLSVGQALIIWSRVKHLPPQKHWETYRIKFGDTLIAIAKRFHVSVKQIKHWNKNARKSYLRAGEKLKLYKV
jgi:peptidoglycan lytic transglycosylase D